MGHTARRVSCDCAALGLTLALMVGSAQAAQARPWPADLPARRGLDPPCRPPAQNDRWQGGSDVCWAMAPSHEPGGRGEAEGPA